MLGGARWSAMLGGAKGTRTHVCPRPWPLIRAFSEQLRGGAGFARGGARPFWDARGGAPPPLFCASETLDAVCTLYVIVYAICIVQYTYLSNYVLHEYNMMVSLYLSCIMVCACMYVECTSYMFVMQTICGGGGWRVEGEGFPLNCLFIHLLPS